jgi:hypothetical protein
MTKLNYFAYGSNMSSRRLKARVPSATVIGTGVLSGHRLAFHKVSKKDGSGKCDVVESIADEVSGVLIELSEAEKSTLDGLEGLGFGYREKLVTIILNSGERVTALTYFATNTNPNLKPYTWYKRHVIEGAKEAKLPFAYLAILEEIAAIEDPDKEREAQELAIYR